MIRFSLRIPDALHERIKRLADRDKRSINGQLLAMLEDAARREEKKK
jgi:hypothetical protein